MDNIITFHKYDRKSKESTFPQRHILIFKSILRENFYSSIPLFKMHRSWENICEVKIQQLKVSKLCRDLHLWAFFSGFRSYLKDGNTTSVLKMKTKDSSLFDQLCLIQDTHFSLSIDYPTRIVNIIILQYKYSLFIICVFVYAWLDSHRKD